MVKKKIGKTKFKIPIEEGEKKNGILYGEKQEGYSLFQMISTEMSKTIQRELGKIEKKQIITIKKSSYPVK